MTCLDFNAISIPRWTTCGSHILYCALHRFSDASTAIFAAAVYLRTINIGSIIVSLLAAKSKVARLKTISVPRFELSAALLLVRLMHFACSALTSESRVSLLGGLHHYTRLAESITFPKENLANRVSAVQSLLPGVSWRHVPTSIPRTTRLAPDLFQTYALWWSGPPWLHPPESWPNSCPSVLLQCSSRTTLRIFNICLVRYAQLGSRIALFFLAKIATNYRLSVSFSKSTPML